MFTHGFAWRITLPMLGLLLMVVWQETSAQESSLSSPGAVQPDTVYGSVGAWFVLRNQEGETLPFGHFKDQVLFVNFWSTWCAPCVEELPTIVELTDALGDSEVVFLLISIDDDERAVHQFVRKHPLPVPVYFRGWPAGESTFTGGMVPATFIISREGEIAYQHHGAANWNTEPIRRFLRELAQR